MKEIDYIIILSVILISFKLIFSQNRVFSERIVEIKTPYKDFKIELNKNKIIEVKGRLGYLKLEIKKGKVRVIDSPCPKKICVKTGWISKPNQMIICIPNGVIIKILGMSNKKEVDFFTY